jgi:hypothetical protein
MWKQMDELLNAGLLARYIQVCILKYVEAAFRKRLSIPLLDLGRFFSFLILYTVGRTPWTGDQPIASSLSTPRTTETENKRTQYRHPGHEWDSNPRSQLSSEREQFMP